MDQACLVDSITTGTASVDFGLKVVLESKKLTQPGLATPVPWSIFMKSKSKKLSIRAHSFIHRFVFNNKPAKISSKTIFVIIFSHRSIPHESCKKISLDISKSFNIGIIMIFIVKTDPYRKPLPTGTLGSFTGNTGLYG